MSEGPVSFGKPLMWLVILGCGGGGYYAYTKWPVAYEGAGWSVSMPNKWQAGPANDPSDATKIHGSGPLAKTPAGEEQTGVLWAKVVYHGALDWDGFMRLHLPGTPDWTQDLDVDYKKARLYMYEDKDMRYFGVAVDRGDAMVFYAMGTNKLNFPLHKAALEKSVRSVRCQR